MGYACCMVLMHFRYKLLRELDRKLHRHEYPRLDYDNLFLLHNGYRSYHAQFPEKCVPVNGYVPMKDGDHTRHRRAFKTWRSHSAIDLRDLERKL
jgi:hypothetical protein